MKVSGEAKLHAPVEKVWAALNDPAVLVQTIPGCERLETTGPDEYRMTVTAGVASIKGTYAGEVRITDQVPPGSFVMTASGAGGPGTVSTEVQVKLIDAGAGVTVITYDADAVVGGVIAGVGQRMLGAVAKKMAGEFFAAVDDVLTGKPQPASVPAAAAIPGTAAEAPAADGVYLAASSHRSATTQGSARFGSPGFALGAVFGAAVALVSFAVGVLVGQRNG